jgi:hypothetical protein
MVLTQAQLVDLEERVSKLADELHAVRGVTSDVPADYVGTMRVNLHVLSNRAAQCRDRLTSTHRKMAGE